MLTSILCQTISSLPIVINSCVYPLVFSTSTKTMMMDRRLNKNCFIMAAIKVMKIMKKKAYQKTNLIWCFFLKIVSNVIAICFPADNGTQLCVGETFFFFFFINEAQLIKLWKSVRSLSAKSLWFGNWFFLLIFDRLSAAFCSLLTFLICQQNRLISRLCHHIYETRDKPAHADKKLQMQFWHSRFLILILITFNQNCIKIQLAQCFPAIQTMRHPIAL